MRQLNESDKIRFDRQIRIDGWGEKGQKKLKNSTVGILGVGGLGCPISVYLAVAGIGRIILVDKDIVELSNLNRQILHWDKDIDKFKAQSAKQKLSEINPGVEIITYTEEANEDNIERLFDGADAVVDALDNFESRLLLNKFAVSQRIPLFHGAVWGLEGRATTILPGKTICLNCIYKEVPKKEVFPVAGVTPAVIGSIQATEVLKYLTGIGELLANRLLIYDGELMEFNQITLNRDPNCPVCGKLTD